MTAVVVIKLESVVATFASVWVVFVATATVAGTLDTGVVIIEAALCANTFATLGIPVLIVAASGVAP